MILAIHDEAVVVFGGLPGVRDMALLDSAIDKPKNLLALWVENMKKLLLRYLCQHATSPGVCLEQLAPEERSRWTQR